jgi:hypothetical protein
MIVVEPDGRSPAPDLVQYRIGKATVYSPVPLPMPSPDSGQRWTEMTERPEELVGVAEIIAMDITLVQPEATQGVPGCVDGDPDPIIIVDHRGIRTTTTPRYPGPAHRLEQRIQSGCHPSSRPEHLDLPDLLAPDMLVGFPVTDYDKLFTREFGPEERTQIP